MASTINPNTPTEYTQNLLLVDESMVNVNQQTDCNKIGSDFVAYVGYHNHSTNACITANQNNALNWCTGRQVNY